MTRTTAMEAYNDGPRRRPREGMPSAAAAEQPSLLGDEPTASVTGPRSRTGDPSTSHRAAVVAAGSRDLSTTQAAVLELVRSNRIGATDDEIWSYWAEEVACGRLPKKSPQRIRTCRADLVKLGYLADSGVERSSALGNPSVVWIARPRP